MNPKRMLMPQNDPFGFLRIDQLVNQHVLRVGASNAALQLNHDLAQKPAITRGAGDSDPFLEQLTCVLQKRFRQKVVVRAMCADMDCDFHLSPVFSCPAEVKHTGDFWTVKQISG